jgi:ABC-type glycerol-3-phosphate transport system substrate-binding protein
MKGKLIALLLAMSLALAGCSGSKSNTPDEKVATINSMMSKGYEISDNQRNKVNQMLEDGRKLAADGKTEEANKLFDKAINMLELIAETDRFNKSE